MVAVRPCNSPTRGILSLALTDYFFETNFPRFSHFGTESPNDSAKTTQSPDLGRVFGRFLDAAEGLFGAKLRFSRNSATQ